jgi:GAF domain-containing protein
VRRSRVFCFSCAWPCVANIGGFWAGLVASVLSTVSLDVLLHAAAGRLVPNSGDQAAGVGLFLIVRDPYLPALRAAGERCRPGRGCLRPSQPPASRHRAAGEAVTPQQVLDAIVTEGVEAAEARAGAIGLLTPDGETIEIVAARGYEQDASSAGSRFHSRPRRRWARPSGEEAVFLQHDRRAKRSLPVDRGSYRPESRARDSPLVDRGQAIGAIAFTFRTEVDFDDERRALKATLAQQAAQALDRVRLYEAERSLRQRMTFLADASELLGSSLDYERTLRQLAQLAVPEMATWCSVDMLGSDGSLQRLAVAHEDPERLAWAERLGEEYPPDPDAPMGVWNVVKTMTAEFVPEITEELLVEAAQGDERLIEIVRELALRSAITVPLVARGRALGALTLIRDDNSPRYTELDLDLASELARRAASAVDNAALYREAERRGDAARALSHVDDGVVLLDEKGAVVSVNPAAARILGVERLRGRREALTAIPGWSSIDENARPGPSQTRGPVTLPLTAPDGGERWVSVSGVDFGDGSVYALRDVSEERVLERARSDFVATASHELRTPLAAVLGAVKTIRREDVDIDPRQREALMQMIDHEAERLSGIVSQILPRRTARRGADRPRHRPLRPGGADEERRRLGRAASAERNRAPGRTRRKTCRWSREIRTSSGR